MDELKVTENIILLTLKELNISKSPGPDKINARLLIELSENICFPLQKIFETSIKHQVFLMNGRMPNINTWKLEKII